MNPLDTLVYVMPMLNFKGIFCMSDMERVSGYLEPMTIRQMLDREFDKAHYAVQYSLKGQHLSSSPEKLVRVNKSALPGLRAAGYDLEFPVLLFDCDLPDKQEWENKKEVQDALLSILKADLPDPTVFYPSLHGYRLLYVLAEPLSAEEVEVAGVAIRKKFLQAGIKLDEKCKDWTRVQGCARIVKSDVKISEQPWFFVEVRDDQILDAKPYAVGAVKGKPSNASSAR